MEFVQIIVIIAVIGFYVARNMRREAARDRKRNPARPVAVPPPAPADMPLPEREYREAEATISPPASGRIWLSDTRGKGKDFVRPFPRQRNVKYCTSLNDRFRLNMKKGNKTNRRTGRRNTVLPSVRRFLWYDNLT